MRFNEEMNEERGQEEPVKKGKKEEPRKLAGSKDYDYSSLGGNKPFMGSNPWS